MEKCKHIHQTVIGVVATLVLVSTLVLSTGTGWNAYASGHTPESNNAKKFSHLAPTLDVTLAPDGKALLLRLTFKSPAIYNITLDGQECGRGEIKESSGAERLERVPFDPRGSEWLLKVGYKLHGVEDLTGVLDGCVIRLLKVTWQNGKAQIDVTERDAAAAISSDESTKNITTTSRWGTNTIVGSYAGGKVQADGVGNVTLGSAPASSVNTIKNSIIASSKSSVDIGAIQPSQSSGSATVNTIEDSAIIASSASSVNIGMIQGSEAPGAAKPIINTTSINASSIGIAHERDDVVRPLRPDREQYAELPASPVHLTAQDPVSTFSIDVDTGAYSNIRRFLNTNRLPPRDAVRIEELVNYFDYKYPKSSNGTPFSISTEVFDSPFKAEAKILKIALRADDRETSELPPANLVFLVDVSGSMYADNKLPLVKQTLHILTKQLRPQDRVAIVTYSSGEKLALPSTSGANKAEILRVVDSLYASGATAGEQALQMAYREAEKSYIKNGINRIILATDGDFNVGVSDDKALVSIVAEKRKSGISLSALGYGTGNYNEAMMEKIADAGNGNFFYIDSRREAKKVVSRELSATLMTVAQDVKIQVEFNPTTVREYRLIGYENRQLKREDFNNDKVDAGEIGAGAKVTAFYEFVPVGQKGWVDDSRYAATPASNGKSDEYAWLKLRYKVPGGSQSKLLEQPVAASSKAFSAASSDSRFALAVAAYGEALRGGEYNGPLGWDDIHKLASDAKSPDPYGDRAEFIDLIEIAKSLSSGKRQETDINTSKLKNIRIENINIGNIAN